MLLLGGKGVVPLQANWTSGEPFYTTDQNPRSPGSAACLANMADGQSCTLTWTVYAVGSIGDSYDFFADYASDALPGTYTQTIPVEITGTPTPINITPSCPTGTIMCPDGLCSTSCGGPSAVQPTLAYTLSCANGLLDITATMPNGIPIPGLAVRVQNTAATGYSSGTTGSDGKAAFNITATSGYAITSLPTSSFLQSSLGPLQLSLCPPAPNITAPSGPNVTQTIPPKANATNMTNATAPVQPQVPPVVPVTTTTSPLQGAANQFMTIVHAAPAYWSILAVILMSILIFAVMRRSRKKKK